MRVVKEAEERKNEILDAAEELFAAKGFDGTSTADILDKVGIARGTLYYHFRSKEDILDAVVARMATQMMEKAEQIAVDRERPVFERLTGSIMALNSDTMLAHEIMEQIHKPQNALMHQKMQEQLLTGIVPIISKLLEEGKSQGLVHADYLTEAVEMLMLYANTVFDNLLEQSEEQRKRRIEGFIYHTERLLGAERDAMKDAILQIFEAV